MTRSKATKSKSATKRPTKSRPSSSRSTTNTVEIDAVAKLTEARAMIDRGDHAGALRPLLDVWRAVPDPQLATMIEQVGPIAARGRSLPAATDEEEAQWIDRVRLGDPADLDMLLASLRERVYRHRELLAALERPDPRLTSLFVTELAKYSGLSHLWKDAARPMFDALAACGDPRALDAFEDIRRGSAGNTVARLRASVPKRLAVARTALEARRAVLAPEARALLVDVVVPVEEQRLHAELLAAIYAAPADDTPRSIYADYLIELGDPRGELIALQLANPDARIGDPNSQRTYRLLEAHREAWLGPLAKYVERHGRYRRGFLVSCEVTNPVPDPAWATVESIRYAIPATDEYPMPVLREARDVYAHHIEHLATLRSPPPLESLEVASFDFRHVPALRTALAKLRLPKLARLELKAVVGFMEPDGIGPHDLPMLLAIGPIRHLRVHAEERFLSAWKVAVELSSIARFELVPPTGSEIYEHICGSEGWWSSTLEKRQDLMNDSYVNRGE